MALPTSSLSQTCRAIADFVSAGLQASARSIRIMVGNPSEAVPGQADTEHRVNLFFYRFEPSNIYADTSPGEVWWLRLHCLVTSFAVAEDNVSSGENDLRLLGEVIRLFHETPVLHSIKVENEEFQLQLILQPLNADNLNHIWSTQSDVSYRPSVAYEIALAPVIPAKPRVESPLTGSLGFTTRGGMDHKGLPYVGEFVFPQVSASMLDYTREDWAPEICFVHDDGCALSLVFQEGSDALANFQPRVWIAGESGSIVTLTWERWTREEGWQPVEVTLETSATTSVLDPEQAATAVTQQIALPSTDRNYQAVLYAKRTYRRAVDNKELIVRSNPLLVTIYQDM